MATAQLIVHKTRTNVVPVNLGDVDISSDEFTSEIRVDKNPEAELIATWTVTFFTDGTDGKLVLTLDDTVTADITKSTGYMDIKRVSAGEPLDVFSEPLEVLFRDVVTA